MMSQAPAKPRWELVQLDQTPGVPCSCGTSRRAFGELEDFPASIHRTEISQDARRHYHKRLTEVYYVLECEPQAQMELDGELVSVRPGSCVLIRPGVRHRAVGTMTVLIFVQPKHDPQDEWYD